MCVCVFVFVCSSRRTDIWKIFFVKKEKKKRENIKSNIEVVMNQQPKSKSKELYMFTRIVSSFSSSSIEPP